MEKKHLVGLLLSLVLALAILVVLFLLRSHPANVLKKTLAKVGADRTRLHTYYSANYIDTVCKGFKHFVEHNAHDSALVRRIGQLNMDELFFYSWVLVVNNQVAWPKIYSHDKRIVVIEYTIKSTPNFSVKIMAKESNGILVFQSISSFDKLLFHHSNQVKIALEKKVNEY